MDFLPLDVFPMNLEEKIMVLQYLRWLLHASNYLKPQCTLEHGDTRHPRPLGQKRCKAAVTIYYISDISELQQEKPCAIL
ncbi:hypothetical protein GRJ2_002026300 [Grus japonensis]|uniref:Uncharacterized protein n=1 Tax=Grus japonensis TaxID=30415 RepID=A0ABC9XD78_GRUJA